MRRFLLLTLFVVVIGTLLNAADLNTTFNSGSFDQVSTTIENVEVEKTNIYPNPTRSIINVESKSIINSVIVFDVTGQVVNTINNVDDYNVIINLSDYKTGIYFIKVNDIVNKVIKK